jgi:hypothetical protein
LIELRSCEDVAESKQTNKRRSQIVTESVR